MTLLKCKFKSFEITRKIKVTRNPKLASLFVWIAQLHLQTNLVLIFLHTVFLGGLLQLTLFLSGQSSHVNWSIKHCTVVVPSQSKCFSCRDHS